MASTTINLRLLSNKKSKDFLFKGNVSYRNNKKGGATI